MPLTRQQKIKIIDDLKEKIDRQKVMVFVDFKGLRVKDLFELRKKLKKVDSKLRVYKKTLIELVLKEKGIVFPKEQLIGQIAIIFGFGDEILPVKTAFQFSQENPNLKILAGFFENKLRTSEEMIMLATLPTRKELLAKIVSSLSAPISNLMNILEVNLRNLILILSQMKVT